jgi:hypothetical protein
MLGAQGLWAGIEGSLSCHTSCDAVPQFFRSHQKDRLTWRRPDYRWRAAKLRPMLGAQGLWWGRPFSDLYFLLDLWDWPLFVIFVISSCHTCCDTGPRFFRSHQSPRTILKGMWRIYSHPHPHGSPFSRFVRHTWGWWGPILTRILTGQHMYFLFDLFIAAWTIFQPSGGCHHYRWLGCKFRPMLGAQGL